jgi:hypothetical protein
MSLKQNYDLSEKDCAVYENYVHAEVCAEIERELAASQAEVERLTTISKIIVEYISEYEPRQFYRDLINQNTK